MPNRAASSRGWRSTTTRSSRWNRPSPSPPGWWDSSGRRRPTEGQGWDGWNQHFLDKVVEAASANPGKWILVLVGVEHAYWLRAHLRGSEAVRLLDTERLLEELFPHRGHPGG